MPTDSIWSFRYESGGVACSFEVIAPTQAAAESALSTAVCEGAIAPSESNAFGARQSQGVAQ